MITEETAVKGKIYFVNKQPAGFLPPLSGKGGICKWANYRGVCMRFTDGISYVIPFDCIYDKPQNAAD